MERREIRYRRIGSEGTQINKRRRRVCGKEREGRREKRKIERRIEKVIERREGVKKEGGGVKSNKCYAYR